MLVLKEIRQDQYLGGVLSIAKNLAEISDKITVVSMIGEKKDYLKDINKDLPKKLIKNFYLKKFTNYCKEKIC